MERTIYFYDLKPTALNRNINKIADDYEQEFINILDLLITQPLNERVWDIEADNKILYLDGYEVLENIRTVNMCFISAKYNSVRKVIDTETLKDKGYLKNKEDGDKEKIIYPSNFTTIRIHCVYMNIIKMVQVFLELLIM